MDYEHSLKKVEIHLKAFKQSLVERVDPVSISLKAKIPFKAIDAREALFHRSVELLESAVESLKGDHLVSASLLARAYQETLSILFYINRKCKSAITNKDPSTLDSHLMRVLSGTRRDDKFRNPISVMTAIDLVEKEIPKFRDMYEELSEYSHPNWHGTSGLFSKYDKENLWVDYGKNIRLSKSVRDGVALSLSINSELFIDIYNEFIDFLPQLVEVCESALGEYDT